VFLYYSSSLKYPQAGHPNINTHKALFVHQGIRNLFIYSQSFLVMTCHCQCQNCQYCKETYSPYIYKVLKQVHPDTGISNKAMTYSSYIYKVLKLVQPNTGIPNKTTVTYSSYIYKVLKQVHPNTSISNKATVTYSLYIYKVLNQVHPDTVRGPFEQMSTSPYEQPMYLDTSTKTHEPLRNCWNTFDQTLELRQTQSIAWNTLNLDQYRIPWSITYPKRCDHLVTLQMQL
jgi:hypothetical protein